MTDDPAYLRYYRCLRALNRGDAEAIVESYLADGGSIEGLYADVIMPAMDHVGRQWQLGRISVAHEHYISEVTRDLVGRYGPRIGPGGSITPPIPVSRQEAPLTDDPAYLRYYRCLRALNRGDAEAIVESYLADGGSIEGLYADVIMPAMDHVGRQWQLGRISVAHEHYISEVTRDLVGRYGPRMYADVPARGLVAVLGCVPGERHSIGLMMIGDACRAGGMVVHALGEGLPSGAIAEFAAEVGADLIGLSCALDIHLPDLVDLIPLVRRARPGIGVAVGGLAIRSGGESMGRRLGADFHAADVREARHRLPGWIAGPGRSRDLSPEFLR